jgi:hypothetical protein
VEEVVADLHPVMFLHKTFQQHHLQRELLFFIHEQTMFIILHNKLDLRDIREIREI